MELRLRCNWGRGDRTGGRGDRTGGRGDGTGGRDEYLVDKTMFLLCSFVGKAEGAN